MKNNKVWSFLKPIIVLTVIAAVMAALLGGTNLLTKDKIRKIEEKNQLEAIKKVIKADNYILSEIEFEGTSYDYYKATNSENMVLGYVFSLSSNGYGGAVKSVVGIDKNGEILAVEILDVSNETPGLGQNATRSSFTDQFKNHSEPVEVNKSATKENEIQAVTGATITSKAVANSVNLALELFATIGKAGGK